ncbi:hypothetical protein LC2W_3120 [Lacticaseibacillus paracasei]|nr:hypothetical protein LC2W_3120 [Lacticaseibacillus paracasei]AEA58627.1 hypothetical protein LCBD_3138 [Lacticaseibacillus paracasei]KTE99697.1 hypothetical protein AC564_0591 [Lacticaseibacillus paracasei]
MLVNDPSCFLTSIFLEQTLLTNFCAAASFNRAGLISNLLKLSF